MKAFIYILVISILWSCDTNKTEKNTLANRANVMQPVDKLPYFDSADFTPKWEKPVHKIPEFSFVNQNGKEITHKTYEGKIYVADFFFTTCPGICPKLEKHMSLLQDTYKMDDNFMLLSHTVMPWVDNVTKLKAYEVDNNIDSNKWNLVTGDREDLYKIARFGYFADEDFVKTQDESEFIHTENFLLIDKEGYIRGVYNGTVELDIKRLMRHIDILKKEG